MYIKKVELENIKKFDKASIEFKTGVNFISGKNGAGKTTIIESIGYAIFGAPVSNKGFINYLIKKGKTNGKIRVTILDKDNNEIICERKISSKGVWSVKKMLDDKETVLATGNEEVPAYLKDHLDFYPDDNMSQIYEKIVSVPQGEITAAFFGTEKSRKETFDPLFKLDTYRSAFERIKLIKSITDENIELEKEISRLQGSIENKDKIIQDSENFKKLIDEKNNELENHSKIEKEVQDDFDKLDKINKEIEKLRIEISKKKLEKDNLINLKTRLENDLKQISESEELLKNNKESYEKYLSLEKDIRKAESDLTVLEEVRNKHDELITRKEKGNVQVEERNKNLLVRKNEIDELKKNISNNEEKIKSLTIKKKELSSGNSNDNSNFDIDKLNDIKNKLYELYSDKKSLEKEMKNSLLGNNQSGKELLYINTASNKINKIISLSSGEVNELANQAIQNLNMAIDITKNNNITSPASDLIQVKEKLEKDITNIIFGYIKDNKLLEKFGEDIDNGKQIFDDYYNKIISSYSKPNDELIKIETELNSLLIINDKDKKSLEEKEMSYKSDFEEMNKWITGIKGFDKKLLEMKDDYEKYEVIKKSIKDFKNEELKLKESYELYLQNVKKVDSKDNLLKDIDLNDKSLKELENTYGALSNSLAGMENNFDKDEFEKVSKKLTEVKTNSKTYEVEINNLKNNYDKLLKQLDDIKEIEKSIKEKELEVVNNKKIIEIVRKLRNVINEAPEAIANILIQNISARACDIYSKIASDSNRLEWEKSYELALYDNFDGNEIKKEFKQLSGGEQMAAALAVRLSMLENLTKLKIGILDEPTTNIDANRREKLASVVYDVASNFNQLIVVSHDDTFENITENVVELTGGNVE